MSLMLPKSNKEGDVVIPRAMIEKWSGGMPISDGDIINAARDLSEVGRRDYGAESIAEKWGRRVGRLASKFFVNAPDTDVIGSVRRNLFTGETTIIPNKTVKPGEYAIGLFFMGIEEPVGYDITQRYPIDYKLPEDQAIDTSVGPLTFGLSGYATPDQDPETGLNERYVTLLETRFGRNNVQEMVNIGAETAMIQAARYMMQNRELVAEVIEPRIAEINSAVQNIREGKGDQMQSMGVLSKAVVGFQQAISRELDAYINGQPGVPGLFESFTGMTAELRVDPIISDALRMNTDALLRVSDGVVQAQRIEAMMGAYVRPVADALERLAGGLIMGSGNVDATYSKDDIKSWMREVLNERDGK